MIKNLKITDNLKEVMKKGKKLVLMAALSLGLTACSNESNYVPNNNYYEYDQDDYDKNYNNNYNQNDGYYNGAYNDKYDDGLDNKYSDTTQKEPESNNNDNNDTPSIEVTYDDAVIDAIVNSKVTFNQNNIADINSTIDSIDVEYLYSEYFGVDEAIDIYNANKLISSSNGFKIISNNKIDFDALYKSVKLNNSSYKEQYDKITKFQTPSDSELKDICTWICDSANKELEKGLIDINALDEKLQVLKVFKVTDFTYGYYSSDDGMIAYNKNTIDTLNRKTAFQETIWHETKHLVQAASESQKNGTTIKNNYGPCYEFDNLKVNSLHPNWLFEGAAESITMKELGIPESANYQEFIKSLNMLTMTNITKHNVGMLENICMQSDLDKLYEYFGANTPEQKKEISTMLFAYNIILNDSAFSSTKEFYDYYKEREGSSVENKTEYQYQLSSSVSQTLSKIFYRNLADKLNNEEVNIKEIFELISNFEISLSNQSRYYDSRRADALQDFFNNYNVIQQEFFEQIATKLGVKTSDVLGSYQTYYKNNKAPNNNLTIISDDNEKFIDNCYKDYEYYKKGTVYDFSQEYQKSYNK